MNIRTRAAAFTLAVCATPAFADLTADDVLSAMTTQLSAFDLLDVSVQGKTRDGDTLSIARISATADIDGAPMTLSFGPMAYQELNDGSVAILYREPLRTRLITVDGDSPVEVTVDLNMTDASHIATGSPDRIRYAFSASAMQLNNLVIETDETLKPELDANITGISSIVETATGDTFSQMVDYSLDALTVDFKFDEPDLDTTAHIKFAMADVGVDYEIEFTLETLMTSVAQALRDGNRLSLTMTTGEYIQDMRIDTPSEQSVMASRTDGSNMTLNIDQHGLFYEAGYDGSYAEVSGQDMPFGSFTYALGETEIGLAFPLLPSDEPQPFALRTSILGMSVGDDIWNLFDAAGQLPRDPLNFVIDLEGTTRVTEDFLKPDALEGMDQSFFADTTLKLNQLRFSAAGADLTGDGNVTDTTENGVPSAIGQLNMMLTGGNSLLDTLIAMGLVPEDQAMGARMMLGLVARPGEGDDTLVSTIEVNEDGEIFANGQRIK